MKVDGIHIDLQDLEEISRKIQRINATLRDSFNGIEADMKNVAVNWNDAAYSTFREKYPNKDLMERCGKFHDDLEAYALFLQKTVDAYKGAETSVKKNADSFR